MIELAEIFKEHGGSYLNKYSAGILPSHLRVYEDILKCRTALLGGKVYFCPDCKKYEYSYHSCGNRHCPKCQNNKADKWLEKNNKLLLPVNYFMITFTLPGSLRRLARSNQKTFYNLLFKCSSKAIEKLSSDSKYIGAKPGMISVLHTWSRTLVYHPHLHYVITGGGFSKEKNEWINSRDNFLFPVLALSIIFRAKFRDELKKTNPALFNLIPTDVWYKDWVVNSIPVGRGDTALKYLAQYVFRVAISSSRIVKFENGIVTFKYKDSKTNIWKTMELEAEEFIRRFSQHILPDGFVKVRYLGLFASSNRKLLSEAGKLLGYKIKTKQDKRNTNKAKAFRCPGCHKEMETVSMLQRPSRRYNKAPPQGNDFVNDLTFNRCA